MRRLIIGAALAAAITTASGCAKVVEAGKNDASKRYLDAWVKMHIPDAQKVDPGFYIIEDTPGTGTPVGDQEKSPYVRVNYTSTDLEGNVAATTSEHIARKIGTYTASGYYGPKIFPRANNVMAVGLDAAVTGMNVGGKRKVLIPGWLTGMARYDSEEGYIKNVTGTDYIYEFEVVETFSDIKKWELAQTEAYVRKNLHGIDSTKLGYYYYQEKAPTDTTSFKSGDKVKVWYVGRLLDGHVFDTNIKDSAKVYGLYNSSAKYEALSIDWKDDKSSDDSDSKESSSSGYVTGFADTVFSMKTGEKGTTVFYSELGYGSSGSGSSIPAYSPLRFDIILEGK